MVWFEFSTIALMLTIPIYLVPFFHFIAIKKRSFSSGDSSASIRSVLLSHDDYDCAGSKQFYGQCTIIICWPNHLSWCDRISPCMRPLVPIQRSFCYRYCIWWRNTVEIRDALDSFITALWFCWNSVPRGSLLLRLTNNAVYLCPFISTPMERLLTFS